MARHVCQCFLLHFMDGLSSRGGIWIDLFDACGCALLSSSLLILWPPWLLMLSCVLFLGVLLVFANCALAWFSCVPLCLGELTQVRRACHLEVFLDGLVCFFHD